MSDPLSAAQALLRQRVTVTGFLDEIQVLSSRGVTTMTVTLGCASDPRPVVPVEQWQKGDVVRNAVDEADPNVWIHDGSTDSDCWATATPKDGMDYFTRTELPERLTLLVRDGKPVSR